MALPALTINYLGQGSLVLANEKAIENPFFLLYPEWALLPAIALATAATVIKEVKRFVFSSAAPEPSTWAMMVLAFLEVGFMA